MNDKEKKQRKPKGYWNVYEHCIEEAKKYSTRNEFQEKNAVAYNYTRKNGWIDDCVWFVNGYKLMGEKKIIWTYDACYKEALKYKTKKELEKLNPSVYNRARENNWLKDYTWFEEVRKPNGYWNDYDNCYNEAKKYKSRSEFEKGCSSACNSATKNGWLIDYVWFEQSQLPRGYWDNYEKCYNEAKKYNTISEFQKGNGSAYNSSKRNGWFDNYDWFEEVRKPNGYWNDYDNCYNEAKKYNMKRKFEEGCGSAYNSALKNGWIDDYDWFDRGVKIITDKVHSVYGYIFNEQHTIYIGRTCNQKKRHKSHSTKDCPVKRFADSNDTVVPEMTILEDSLTLEESLIYEDLYVEQYRNDGWNLINKSKTGLKSGSIGAIAHKWTKNACYNEAKKYKTRREFEIGNGSAYLRARKNGWLNDYTWFDEIKKQNGYWHNYDNCYNAAKECTKRSEFKKKYYQGWYESLKNGWINDYTWFINGNKVAWQRLKNREDQSKCVCQYSLDGEFIKEWPSLAEIERHLGFSKANISACCKNKYGAITRYGYIWKYAA